MGKNTPWETLEGTEVEDQTFKRLILDNFLSPHVLEPSRETTDIYICFRRKNSSTNVKIQEPLGGGVHTQLRFNIKIKSDKTNVSQGMRTFRKGNDNVWHI